MESLDSILADLQGKYKNDPKTSLENDVKSSREKPTSQTSSSNSQLNSKSKSNSSSLDLLLDELRNDSVNSNSLTVDSSPVEPIQVAPVPSSINIPANLRIKRDLQQVADRQRQQSQKEIAQQIAEQTKQAEAWLKQLDPLSGEGLWFEEFAKNYPSRLEAAIALLSS